MDEKRCYRCGKVRPMDMFCKAKGTIDGLSGQCRPCRTEKSREYRARMSPEVQARRRAETVAYNKKRSEALAEERRRNPLPPRKPAEGTPEWAAYAQRNAWKKRIYAARAQARRFGCEVNDLTIEDWESIVAAHEGRCFYCQATGNMWIEHVRPLHLGYPNSKSNVVPACESCNRHKMRRSMEQFLADRCGRDHPMTPDNVYTFPNGKKRVCKTCRRESFRRHNEKRKQRKAAAA